MRRFQFMPLRLRARGQFDWFVEVGRGFDEMIFLFSRRNTTEITS